MELIPILSTIILVATISTFLLAIGAYVLYKVRERKGQRVAAVQPSAVKAEIVTPGEAPAVQQEQVRVAAHQGYFEQEPVRVQRQPVFAQQYKPVAQAAPKWQSAQPRQFNAGDQPKGSSTNRYSEEKSQEKFYKYTTEGYVNPKEDKESGALRWR